MGISLFTYDNSCKNLMEFTYRVESTKEALNREIQNKVNHLVSLKVKRNQVCTPPIKLLPSSTPEVHQIPSQPFQYSQIQYPLYSSQTVHANQYPLSSSQAVHANQGSKKPVNIYFNWATDLHCIDQLFDDFKKEYSGVKRIFEGSIPEKPCILFIFIAVVSRIDHDLWPKKTAQWNALADGNSIVILVHDMLSQSFGDNSIDSHLCSYFKKQHQVLRAKFEVTIEYNGLDTVVGQRLVCPKPLQNQMIALIEQL